METLTKAFNRTSATIIANQVVCFDPIELDNTLVLKTLNDNGYQVAQAAIKNSLVYYVVEKTIKVLVKTTYITAKTLRNVSDLLGVEELVGRVHNSKKLQGDFWNFAGFTGTPRQMIKRLENQLHVKIEMVKSF